MSLLVKIEITTIWDYFYAKNGLKKQTRLSASLNLQHFPLKLNTDLCQDSKKLFHCEIEGLGRSVILKK